MKVGDLVKRADRNGNNFYGVILELHPRTLEHYTQEQIDKDPIRTINVLGDNGKINRWYAVHIEVISETS